MSQMASNLENAYVQLAEAHAEIDRLRAALWAVKVDPHGHPAGPHNLPVIDAECSVCRTILAVLESDDAAQQGSQQTEGDGRG